MNSRTPLQANSTRTLLQQPEMSNFEKKTCTLLATRNVTNLYLITNKLLASILRTLLTRPTVYINMHVLRHRDIERAFSAMIR